ncbi:MAG: carboxypeptidase regulatory-like domain-containing protein [Clostridia bacterium]|nr:carboxypeptidase regulatory-like domain-containing protein [Clostridia bacterium]
MWTWAAAEETSLQVYVYGMVLRADGEWEPEMLSCDFSVYQHDTLIGTMKVNPFGSTDIALKDGSDVTLVPDLDTVTEGYTMDANGYTLGVTENIDNIVHIVAYADAGLFDLYTRGRHRYEVLRVTDQEEEEFFPTLSEDEEETKEIVLERFEIETGEDGVFSLEEPIVSGIWQIRDLDNSDVTANVEIVPYRGNGSEIALVDLRDAYPEIKDEEIAAEDVVQETLTPAPTVVVPAPTAVPTEAPTPVPTEVPTATPTEVPTEAPTAEPTQTPTAAPTEAPTPVPTEVPTSTPTQEPTVAPTSVPTEAPTAEPTSTPTPTPVVTVPPTQSPTATPVPVAEPRLSVVFTGDFGDEQIEWLLRTETEAVESGTLNLSESHTIEWTLNQESYIFQMTVPSGYYMDKLDDVSIYMTGTLEWDADLSETENRHLTQQVTLLKFRTVSVENATGDMKASIVTPQGSRQMELKENVLTAGQLYAGEYQVSIELPKAENGASWDLSGWTAEEDKDGTVRATASVDLTDHTEAVLQAPEFIKAESPAGDASNRTISVSIQGTNEQDEQPEEDVKASVSADVTEYSTAALLLPDAEQNEIPLRTLKTGEAHGSAALSVQVFIDANHNGEKGPYERLLSGAAVDLIQTGNGEDTIVASGRTGSDGMVSFTDLAEGNYIVRCELPLSYGFGPRGKNPGTLESSQMIRQSAPQQESEVVHLSSGTTALFGIAAEPMSGVTGYVWLDVNGDGIHQDDEPGQAGILLECVGIRNGLTYQILTDDDGQYSFTQLRPGSYRFRVTLPDGFIFTKKATAGGKARSIFTDETKSVTAKTLDLNDPKVVEDQNIGVYTKSEIRGTAFLDENANGILDEGERPYEGVKLSVYRQGTNIELDNATTGSDGTYAFSSLRPGTYRVKATLPAGTAFFTQVSTKDDGNRFRAVNGRRDSNAENIEVAISESVTVNAGAVVPSTIFGTVYLDDDFSGSMSGAEKGRGNITLQLLSSSGTVVDTVRTNAKGQYTFEGVLPGTYVMTANAPEGYAFTTPGSGNVMISRGNGNGTTEPIEVRIASVLQSMDVGLVVPGIVEGVMFADMNDNGRQDAGEGGLEGTVVNLVSDAGDIAYTQTIHESSTYRFDAVLPGTYHVEILLPEGAIFAKEVSGGNTFSGGDGMAQSDSFRLQVGAEVSVPVCGALTLGRISGNAYLDPTAEGQYTPGATLLSGVLISLRSVTDTSVSYITETLENGAFELNDIHPGEYELTLVMPEDYVLSRVQAVSLPLEACRNTQTVSMTVQMGEEFTDQHLGAVHPASLSGYAWLDENCNGSREMGEAGAGNETIRVIDLDWGTQMPNLITDQSGQFSLDTMIPGRYRLAYDLDDSTISSEGDTNFHLERNTLVSDVLNLSTGDHLDNLSLGLIRYTTVGGLVWIDRGGEVEALSGAEISLLDEEGMLLQSAKTQGDGMYTFTGLLPGRYRIATLLPEGVVVVEPDDERLVDGGLISIMADCNRRQGQSSLLSVTMGNDRINLNIGGVLPGTLGDFVWLDINGNGYMDTDEKGISGVTLHLMRGEEEITSTSTDAYGYYLFEDIYPAVYTVKVDLPEGTVPTVHREDLPGIVSILTETGESVPVQAISDDVNYDADIGLAMLPGAAYPAGYDSGDAMNWSKDPYPQN